MKKVVLAVLIVLCGVSLSFGGKTYSTNLEVEKCKEDNKCNDKETEEKMLQCIKNCHENPGGSGL